MTSTDLINAAKHRYADLSHKGWEWRAFYNGFLEGALWAFYEQNEEKETAMGENNDH